MNAPSRAEAWSRKDSPGKKPGTQGLRGKMNTPSCPQRVLEEK